MSALLHAVGVRRGRGVAPGVGGAVRRLAGGVAGVARRARGVGVSGRRRRRGGISKAELRGFKKIARLLSAFGMSPRGLHRPMRRAGGRFSPRRHGDPSD